MNVRATASKKEFPTPHQLLLDVLVGQYEADPVAWAMQEYVAHAGAAGCAAALKELDAAAPLIVDGYADLSRFLNYNLESPQEARTLLATLRKGLAAALAPHGT